MGTDTNKRITVKGLIEEALGALFHLERKLKRTIIDLAIRPGKMIRDYVDGKREKYQKPFGLLLIASAIHSIAFYLTHLKQIPAISRSASFDEMYFYNIYYVQTNYFSWIHLGLLPLYTLISVIIFYRSKYNYAEWMVAGCYILSFLLLVIIPYHILNAFIHFNDKVDFFVQLIIVFCYPIWVMFELVPQKNKWLRLIKGVIWVTAVFSLFLAVTRGIAYLVTIKNG